MQYKNNILYTDLKEVSFDFPIKQVLKYRGLYIVLVSPLDNLEYPSNIFAVSMDGDIVWRIKSFNGEQIIFHSMDLNLENGKLYLKDFNHFKYLFDIETGEIISGKLRPLELEPPTDKQSEKKIIPKINIPNSSNLDKKTMIFIGIIIIGLFMIFSKNLKINSLEKKLTENNKLIQTLGTTLIQQEEKITEYEATITSFAQTVQNQQTSQLSIDSNGNIIPTTVITPETTPDTQTQVQPEETREESVKSGVSTVVDFIDSIVGNVSSGTPTTIDDVNKSKTTIGQYTVSSIIDGQRLSVSDGQNIYNVKLISVSDCSASTLESIIPSGTTVFLETDSKKYNDAGDILAYVWVTEPNSENLNSMVNYAILKNKLGTFVNESPNIKYNRHFF